MRASSEPRAVRAHGTAADAVAAAGRRALPGYAPGAHNCSVRPLIREPGDTPPGAVPGSTGRARPDDRGHPGPRGAATGRRADPGICRPAAAGGREAKVSV